MQGPICWIVTIFTDFNRSHHTSPFPPLTAFPQPLPSYKSPPLSSIHFPPVITYLITLQRSNCFWFYLCVWSKILFPFPHWLGRWSSRQIWILLPHWSSFCWHTTKPIFASRASKRRWKFRNLPHTFQVAFLEDGENVDNILEKYNIQQKDVNFLGPRYCEQEKKPKMKHRIYRTSDWLWTGINSVPLHDC